MWFFRTLWAVFVWIVRQVWAMIRWGLRQAGRSFRSVGRDFLRWVRRTLFGNWRRAGLTLLVAAVIAGQYYPDRVWPVLAPLLQIAIAIFGIRVMLIPFWPMRRRR